MELRSLRYLVALADDQSFTRAARRVGIAQPALSQQIRKLEAEVGLALVDRTTRRVTITEAGQTLVEHARRILQEAELAEAELQQLSGLRTGRLSIGATHTMGSVDLSHLLAGFHRAYPSIELAVHEDVSLSLAAALRRDELDLAFITVSANGLDAHKIASEPLVAIVPPGHPLAKRRRLRASDLAEETFVAFREGASIRQRFEAVAVAAGFAPTIAFETNQVQRMRALVSQGLAVGIVPRSDARAPGPPVVDVPFSDRSLQHTVFIGWRSGRRHSPAARAFLTQLRLPAPISVA